MTDAQIAAASAAKPAAKPAAAPDDSAARAAAAAAAGQTPIRDTGQGNTPLTSQAEKDRLQQLAGIKAAPESNPEAELDPTIMKARADQEAAARAGQAAQPPAFDPRVYGGEKAGLQGTTPAIIRPNAMAQPGEAPVADVDVYKRSEMDDFGREGNRKAAPAQASTPTAKTAAPKISPAIVGYASRMGLYKNGQPDPVAIKAFQEKNGLKADGIIGANTSGAILSAAKPGAGKQGGAPAPADRPAAAAAPAQRGANTKAPTPVTPGRTPAPALTNRTPPTKMSYDKNGKPLYPMPSPFPANESQDIQRMRFLAGLSKD
jgi:murein L,D-transpeptidase YcbB/YkuD